MNITIVGGGFGGIKAALELASSKEHNITLISDSENFQYYPALFSTATGHSYRQSWVPLTNVIGKHKNISLVLDKIVKIIPNKERVVGESGQAYGYDKLILALGSVTTYFGIEGLDEYSFGIKSEQEIRELQSHLWDEMRDGSDDEKNYVVIGAGPTGVELAGALGEYLRTLRVHFNITKKTTRILLVEAAPRVLPRSSERVSKMAERRLKKLGVKVKTNVKVEKQLQDSLLASGKVIPTETVVWTSGVANAPFYSDNAEHFELDGRRKVVVDEYMQARENVYVIGDNAATPYAGLAQTALHDAIYVSKHIDGKKAVYKPKHPPSVVPIGHRWALFEWGKLSFGGIFGAVLRRAADLIGYNDVLPATWALGAWRAGTKKQLLIPPKDQM